LSKLSDYNSLKLYIQLEDIMSLLHENS